MKKEPSELHKGDKVEWKTSQGPTQGTVDRKLTHDMTIKGHTVKASPAEPEYLVTSGKTGAKAAHKRAALKNR